MSLSFWRVSRPAPVSKITDTAAGVYDVKFTDKTGRSCVVSNVEIKTGAVFSIEEKALKGCSK